VDTVAGFDYLSSSFQWTCPAGHRTSGDEVVDRAVRHLERQGVEFVRRNGHRQETIWYAGPTGDGGLGGWTQLVEPTVVVLALNPVVVAVIDSPIEWRDNFWFNGGDNEWRGRPILAIGQGVVDGTRLPLPEQDSGWAKSVRIGVIGEDGLPSINASVPGELTHAGVTIRWSHVPGTGGPGRWLEFSISNASEN
jgi:hypothetical protein